MLRILTIGLFLFSLSTADSFAEPSLNVEQVIEEKSVPTGKEIKGKLVLKNKGDELLKILGVSSTCGCTTLKLKERRIKPGNVVDLEARPLLALWHGAHVRHVERRVVCVREIPRRQAQFGSGSTGADRPAAERSGNRRAA